MPLDALASAEDLAARDISVPPAMDATVLLNSASAAVRDAAGCAISRATSTVTLVARDLCSIDLPAGPVTAVASVEVDNVAVTGWRKIGDEILMPYAWTDSLPVEVTITYTHGFTVVPADIVDLVCGMVAIAAKQSKGDYGSKGRLAGFRLDQYSEQYFQTKGADSPSPMALPDAVRDSLRARFGTSAVVVRTR